MNHTIRAIYVGVLVVSGIFCFNNAVQGQYSNFYQYRTYNGLFNDLSSFHEGRAGRPFKRQDERAFYQDDGNSMINRGNPRTISNNICNQDNSIPNRYDLSSLVFTFLQFIDHDITATAEGHSEYYPILVPRGDEYFDPLGFGNVQIPFFRSKKARITGQPRTRNQVNDITAWLDGSVIYGSDEKRAKWLRSGECGKLKVAQSIHGDLLPFNTTDGEYDSPIDTRAPQMANDRDHHGNIKKVYVTGDIRGNEQPGLTALHTLFVREHNRICEELVRRGQCNDEKNYQYARKMVGGYLQSILYNELLPLLGIHPGSDQYDRGADPGIFNTFATAAYRLGHTMVTESIPLVSDDCGTPDTYKGLAETFFNPLILKNEGIDAILRGLKFQVQEEIDVKMVHGLRNFLFGFPGAGGLDLAALNIQRGRDHGLPSYNEGREMFGLSPVSRFDQITSDKLLQEALKSAYNSDVNQIDCWIGMLAEDHVPGKVFGEFISTLWTIQFKNIRQADRFYYNRDPVLSRKDINEIDHTRLSDIILRNTLIEEVGKAFIAGSCNNAGQDAYCVSQGKRSNYEWIDLVSIGDMTNHSGQNEGYAFFPASHIQVYPGQRVKLLLKAGYKYWQSRVYWKIWIDWDQDGKFDRRELSFSDREYGNAIGYLKIPGSAKGGATRMRVAMSHFYHNDPCKDVKYGEVEDYEIQIVESKATPREVHIAQIEFEAGLSEVRVYPNPSRDNCWIQFKNQELSQVKMQIYDFSGQLMADRSIAVFEGENIHRIESSNWPPGTYSVVLNAAGKRYITRLLIID